MDPFSMAMMAVAQVGISYLFPSEGPRLKDLKISASTYGAAIPRGVGLIRVPGNMIWARPIREVKKKKSGKGGSYNEYTYYCTFAMGLCGGPVTAFRKVWADNKLIYDATGGLSPLQVTQPSLDKARTTTPVSGYGSSKHRLRFYYGTEDQLPDSAMLRDLGEQYCPAFRGMAYIMFDDLALEDFGNRIPQITAEVMIGEQKTTVGVTPFTMADGTPELAPNDYEPGEACFDFVRSYMYLRDGDSLLTFSLRNGQKRTTFTNEALGFTPEQPFCGIVCSGPDGSVVVQYGANPTAPVGVARLDPFSMRALAQEPVAYRAASADIAAASAENARLLMLDAAGNGAIYDALSLAVLRTVSFGPDARVVARLATELNSDPTFYVVHRAAAPNTLALSIVTDTTTTAVKEFPGSAIGPMIWDPSTAGVLLFHTHNGARLAKYSEDMEDILWDRSIVGYPAKIAPESRPLESQFCWLHNGKVYLIDTATGDSLDGTDHGEEVGTIDWGDYIARYPVVKIEYYLSGWSYADSLEAYAQAHYMQNSGNTITYLQNTRGGGLALAAPHGASVSNFQAVDAARGVLITLDGLAALIKASNISMGVTVGTLVQWMLETGGMPLVQTDLTLLNQMPLRGYGWASSTDIKNILDQLRRVFLFDLVEREGLLVAVSREDSDNGPGMPTEVILQDMLGESSQGSGDYWDETRRQEADLPSRISLSYMNIERDFETTTAMSQRISSPTPTMFSRQPVAMELNIVMTPKEAKVQVHKMLYAQWLERVEHTSRLPWALINLDPGDSIEVRMNDGRVYQERIQLTEIGADLNIAVGTYSQDTGAYDGFDDIVSDGGTGSGGNQTIAPPGLAVPFVMNTPLMRDMDDQGGSVSVYYVALGNGLPDQPWAGGALLRSTNNLDYEGIPTLDADLEWGTVVGSPLPPPPFGPYALDWTSRLVVRPAIDWFEIEPVTDTELWNGANMVLVGGEIIQFRDCEQNDDGSWTLWNLLRARRGTAYACDTHVAGERFICLDAATVALALESTSSRGQQRYYKAVARGGSQLAAPMTSLVYEPRDLMPYPVADIRRAVTPTEITVTWERCTRMGGGWQNGTGTVPLQERFERYEAYILKTPFAGDLSKGAGPETYARKIDLSSPTFTYTIAQQLEDVFDYETDTLHVVIYQLSDAVGRGFPAPRSVTPVQEF